ncbi:putative beta-galactosidase 7-like [Cocos nucifera]|uniref:beta-galactosidase n=1 Tax=Cocos nucifera TaxID=13894 RepID=A0A8K0II02_COCNU|nr:putative beta-galactosidase 7-like [Cocos nucifera]
MVRSPESAVRFVGIACLLFALSATAAPHRRPRKAGDSGVSYDGRSIMINGRRQLFFSGSIHYPRSTPEFNFTGRYDLVRFIEQIHKHKIGFPYWLKEIPGIVFRTNNEPFKYHMQNFVTKIMDMMKSEKLFFPQGGPIILAQINACNGRNCGDTFTGPNSPTKPRLWTENWTAQYRVFGDPPSQRSAEDIAYSVARFFSNNGTLVNYYMARLYESPESKVCVAFLTNTNTRTDGTVNFRGSGHGAKLAKSFVFQKPMELKQGLNHISILGLTIGFPRYFDMLHGNDPVALDMTSMGKGLAWVNGNCIGRYWVSYLSPLGQPSQSVYHIPRAWLKPKDNLLVIFEEHGGKPGGILVVTVKRDNICTVVSEFNPPTTESFSREDNEIETLIQDVKPRAYLKCNDNKVIRSIAFASFGNPTGACGNFTVGTCHSPQAASIVEKVILLLTIEPTSI